MDSPASLFPHVRRLTVNLNQEDVELFEGLWPVPEGVALHSYLIEGDRRVLVDPWNDGGYGREELAVDLAELGMGWADIHAVAFTQPVAPSVVEEWRSLRPGFEVWQGPTAGTRHDLGRGVFLLEHAGSWLIEPYGALLSGDRFSGLGWIEDEVWAEDLSEDASRYYRDEALRWFSQRPWTPGPFDASVKAILPAHGCATRQPDKFWERIAQFVAWGTGEGLDEVTVVWPDGADQGILALVGGALDCGAGLNLFRVPGDDPTAIAAAARRASLVVVAADLKDDFLAGLRKDVWRPRASQSPEELRTGLVAHWVGDHETP